MSSSTDWAPGVIVLLVALGAGVAVLLRSRSGARLPPGAATRRDELLRQKDAIYTLLREHEAAANVGEPGWTAERDRLELEAARVLRALDQVGDTGPATPAGPGFSARNPRLVGALWGAGTVLFFGALGLTLQDYVKPRTEAGTPTGNAQLDENEPAEPAEPQLTAEQTAQLAALQAAVDAAPDDLAAKNRLGHALLHAGKLMDSYHMAEAVTAKAPDDPEARTHQAIVLIAIGDMTVAGKALDHVLASAPTFSEALAYRGALHFQMGEQKEAIDVLQRAIAADPGLTDTVGPLLAAAKAGKMPAPPVATAESDATGAGPMSGGPMSGGPMSGGAGPMGGGAGPMGGGAASAGPSPSDVNGTLRIDASVAARAKPGDTLFLSARPPGVDRGPPTWVEKLAVGTFPMTFTIGPANAMLGGDPPPALVLTARIDADGNAMTHSPDDIEGKSATLAPGAKDVVVTLGAPAP